MHDVVSKYKCIKVCSSFWNALKIRWVDTWLKQTVKGQNINGRICGTDCSLWNLLSFSVCFIFFNNKMSGIKSLGSRVGNGFQGRQEVILYIIDTNDTTSLINMAYLEITWLVIIISLAPETELGS